MNDCKAYIEKIYKAIKKNLGKIDADEDVDALQSLVDQFGEFYRSLFAKGIFARKDMDRKLAKETPKLAVAAPRQQPVESPTTRKGLGKGSPGRTRKQKVSKRQERTRGSEEFVARKRSLPDPALAADAATAGPPARKIAPRSQETAPRPPSCTITRPPPPPPRPAVEPREALGPQVDKGNAGLKRVQLIRKLSGGMNDAPPNDRELESFWATMDRWRTLDARLVDALQGTWNEAIDDKETPAIEKIVRLAELSNGVVNCAQHFLGNLVREHIKDKNKSLAEKMSLTAGCEALEQQLQEMHSRKYVQALQECACETCNSVLEFDTNYTRYHDALEAEATQPTTEPVLRENRPMHCNDVELIAQDMRTQFSGFSSTSLLKFLYFANSTPLFSPPALSLSTPTDVITTTIAFMEPFLQERKLQDPVPRSWKMPSESHSDHPLLPIPKSALVVFDGDSGEITLNTQSQGELRDLATDRGKIRFRLRHCDAPETDFSIRIYKQQEESAATMTTFMTRHIGIEALRVARKILFEASHILLQVKEDYRGQLSAPLDLHGRRLVNIFVRDDLGNTENFAEKLARLGYTISYYTAGVDHNIDSAMREAIAKKRGIFNLPEEVFTYPYRPWDLRKLWKEDDRDRRYAEARPIMNRPADPVAWCNRGEGESSAIGDDDNDNLPDSEDSDSFLFRVVPCKLFWESRCYVATSQIPHAGRALFIMPHRDAIPAGTHLCMYAEKSTTKEEMVASHSSRAYAIYVSRKKLWFDAEAETGNNLGRFANQPQVLEAFRRVAELSSSSNPQFTEEDWKRVENQLEESCNAKFDTVGDQLVIKAKQEFEASKNPTEVFVNYGGLREYWIPLIMERESDPEFPSALKEVVSWLAKSDECNWSEQQRESWLHT